MPLAGFFIVPTTSQALPIIYGPPQKAEIKRFFDIYRLEHPEQFALLLKMKRKDFRKFSQITQKLIYHQRLRDYRKILKFRDPLKKMLAKNKLQVEKLALGYYQSRSQESRVQIDGALDQLAVQQFQLYRQYRKNKLAQLQAKMSLLEQKWNSENQQKAALIIKRKALWKASRQVY